MYAFLVVFHGAELKNKCFIPETTPFVHFQQVSRPLRRFLGLNQGGGGMWDFFQKKILLQNSFSSDVDYISTVFFCGLYWGRAGES